MIDVPIDGVPVVGRYKRVNLKVDRTWHSALYIPGNDELPPVGVQVGNCELMR